MFDDKLLKVWKCRRSDNVIEGGLPGEITDIYDDGFGVKVSNGEVVFTEIQLAGKGKTSAVAFINGHKDLVGKILK